MSPRSTMLHVRVDEQLKTDATETLAGIGLSLSDAVRILLTRIVRERGLPAGLATDPAAYDAWFRAKVQEALDANSPAIPHDDAMTSLDALIDQKRRAKG